MTRILVDDEELDLYPDTKVATTIRGVNVADITSRFTTHTNNFRLPLTENNIRIYGNANSKNSLTTVPYSTRYVKVIQNGIEIITNGVEVINDITDSINITVYANVYDFFKTIENKTLCELELNLNDSWTDSTIKDYRSATTGLVSPVLDYGNYDGATDDIDVTTYLPSVYYHTIIEAIITEAGYEFSGSVFSSDKYLKFIQPYSRKTWGYESKFIETFNFIAEKTGTQGFGTSPSVVTITNEVKANSYYDNTTSRFTQNKATYSGKFHFYAELTLTTVGGGGDTLNVGIYKNGVILSGASVNQSGTGTLTTLISTINGAPNGITLNHTDYIEIMGFDSPTSLLHTVDACRFWCEPLTEPDTTNIQPDKLLPDISQTDYIKDFLVRFGLLMNEQNGTIYFKSIDEVINGISTSVDLTNKRVRSQGIKFTPLSYAGVNKYTYTKPDDVDNELTGQGSFALSYLYNEKTIYNSFFSSSNTVLNGDILMGQIPIYETSTSRSTFDNEPEIRLMLVRDKYSYEPNVTYDTAQSTYLVAYFEDPAQTNSCSFQDSLDENYVQLIRALQKSKTETIEYLLNEVDILKMNPHTLIFDRDSYYLINSISNFIPGKTTKCELFKV